MNLSHLPTSCELAPSEMSDEEVGATGELSMEELVQRELEALRAVDGVTSATAKDRTSLRKPLNTMVAKVWLQARGARVR